MSERLNLLTCILRSPLVNVSRLELSTAEAAAFISRPRLAILREVYLVAKEEERRRSAGGALPFLADTFLTLQTPLQISWSTSPASLFLPQLFHPTSEKNGP